MSKEKSKQNEEMYNQDDWRPASPVSSGTATGTKPAPDIANKQRVPEGGILEDSDEDTLKEPVVE
jgi:hypothetical protein